MPQPLTRWLPEIDFSPDALALRPDLAVYIAQVSAVWARIEVSLGFQLAVMLHTEARTGVSMYLALTGSAAQEHVLSAAAEIRLPKELKSEFARLLTTVRARAKERNKIVHGLWSIHPEKTNALINCSPDSLVRDTVGSFSTFLVLGTALPLSEEFVRNLMVYEAKDFTQVLDRLYSLHHELQDFGLRVGTAQRERHELIRQLMRGPEAAGDSTPPDTNQTNPAKSS